MSSRFQFSVLGSSLVYPNAIVWSEENLVAVACDNTVFILKPGNSGVRGVITIPSNKPFSLGVIDGGEKDLLSECLLPSYLSRDTRPCVRSLAWSPVGLAKNAGCLIAVCTGAGHVKLYRFPFCEFSVEWIEVGDVTEMLYAYLMKSNFVECPIEPSESLNVTREDSANHDCDVDLRVLRDKEFDNNLPVSDNSSSRKNSKRKRSSRDFVGVKYPDRHEKNMMEIVPVSVYEGKACKKMSNCQLITAQQYASRKAMLTSLTLAWSPILRVSGTDIIIPRDSSSCCSILAVGGKDGRISLWRVNGPEQYSIVKTTCSSEVSLVGLQKAHDTWITAVNWALCASNVSEAQYLLATGSSDGRVRIWKLNGEELMNLSEVTINPFSLLKEVITFDSATVSVISLAVSSQSPWTLHVAVGKGSGSLEVWILDISTRKLESIGCFNAHDHVVTGLTWTFEGRCLYSCSQDNSMKSWILVGNSLCEVPIPSTSPLNSDHCVPYVFDSCFGLAISPGNLAIAVARRFDVARLDLMYERRSLKAAVEFYWIGGQQLDLSSTTSADINCEFFPGFPAKELVCWENNILWALKQYENPDRLLNIWDIVAVLRAFKQSAPEYAYRILLKWLKSYFRAQLDVSITVLSEAFKFLSKLSSRQLHLINIICRHVTLTECKLGDVNNKERVIEELSGSRKDENLWMELLLISENELLERLVSFKFCASLDLLSNSIDSLKDGCWSPDGLSQMEQWVSHIGENVKDHTKFLATEVGMIDKRKLHDMFGYEEDEQCNFCSALVPFESTGYGVCSGVSNDKECNQKHKLERCAVTMRIMPCRPSWHCPSCKRWATKLAPAVIFTMSEYPSDYKSYLESSKYKKSSMPCCPLCGTLLQRLQLEHSLSPSPV